MEWCLELTLEPLKTQSSLIRTAQKYTSLLTISSKKSTVYSAGPLPSNRHHRLEDKRENYQVCSVRYRDGASNTVEENSSVFSLI